MKKHKQIDFCHLHMHSKYSELDAISKIPEMVKRLSEYGHKSACISEHGTIASAPEFWKECNKQGIKPILGCEMYFVPDAEKAKAAKSRKNHHLILIAMNDEGWTNLKKLITKAGEKFYYNPRIDYKDLREHNAGLICMTACLKSPVTHFVAEEQYDEAVKHAQIFKSIFGDRFYIELQDGGLDVQLRVNAVLRRMGEKLDIPVVAAQDSHYVNRDDVESHEAIWAIRTGHTFDVPKGYGKGKGFRPYYSTPEYWLKDAYHILYESLTTESGASRMSDLKQSELERTLEIADRVEHIKMEKKMRLPKYVPEIIIEGEFDSFKFIVDLISQKYKKKFGVPIDEATDEHKERLRKELSDIKFANLADYFLIIWDIVSWAKSKDIPVGPGRGCLTENSYIYTIDGYKSIKDVTKADKVVNSLGQIVNVVNTASFDVSENIVEIKSYYDFWSNSQFTKDHKILVKRGKPKTVYKKTLHPSDQDNIWCRADCIKVGDYVCVPKMNHFDHDNCGVSYWSFDSDELSEIKNGFLIERTPINKHFRGSIRHLHKLTGISRNCLKDIVRNGLSKKYPSVIKKLQDSLVSLNGVPSNIEEWTEYTKQNRFLVSKIPSPLPIDVDFAKFVGLWIGDGCYRKTTGISFFLGPGDSDALVFMDRYLKYLGVRYTKYSPKNKESLITYDIQSRALNKMFSKIFGYVKSDSKFIPESFMYSRKLMEGVLVGLIWSDGSLSGGRVCFDTTSERLMFDIRRLLYYLDTPSSVVKRTYREPSNEKVSYKIRLARSNTVVKLFKINPPQHGFYFEDHNYMYCAVRDIKEKKFSGEVYDIAVSGNCPSFLTGGYIVHNSAAGSFVSYVLGITAVDPIKYGLIWERFYNVGRKGSMADIDLDFSKKRREEVLNYIKERFGDDKVAQMVTFNTLKAKAALKDTAKLLGSQGMSFEDANLMTKYVIGKPDVTIEQALDNHSKLKEYKEKNERLFRIARDIEGCPKSSGKHAAGVIISDQSFDTGCIPLRWDTRDKKMITEWDGSTLEGMGYLKVDVLGLKTMDVLDGVRRDVNERYGKSKSKEAS